MATGGAVEGPVQPARGVSEGSVGATTQESPPAVQGRKYKSRGQPPCDACRKRRICCARLPGATDCALCQTRQVSCTYESVPVPKHGRGPSRRHTRLWGVRGDPDFASSPSSQKETAIEKATTSPSKTSATLTEPTRWITQFIGLSGDQDPFVLRHCTFDADCYKRLDWACLRVSGGAGNSHGGRARAPPDQFAVVPDTHLDARPSYYPTDDVWKTMMSSDERHRLLTVYASTIHTSFPLLDVVSVDAQFQGKSSVLLAAICALAAPFVRDFSLQQRSALYRYVPEALTIERRHPRLEAVEAALVFVQRHASIHRAPTTPGMWAEIGSVVGMCHELGLNVDPSAWHITAEHRNRRIRLWWGTYILTTFLSLGLGRPSYISDDDCNVPMLGLNNFDCPLQTGGSDTSTQPATPVGCTNFVVMAHLATVLSRLLAAMYSLAAVARLRHAPPDDVHLLFLTFQQQLLQLKTHHLDNRPPMAEAFLDSSRCVDLAFHAVEIALCRATLRNLESSYIYYTSVRRYAKEAVEAVVKLLRTLQINQLRAYWWNPLSQIHFSLAGSFLFYLMLSSTEEDEIEYWTSRIKEFRQLLELHNYGFDVTRLAATRMALLASANVEPLAPQSPHDASPSSSEEGAYFDGDLQVELGTE